MKRNGSRRRIVRRRARALTSKTVAALVEGMILPATALHVCRLRWRAGEVGANQIPRVDQPATIEDDRINQQVSQWPFEKPSGDRRRLAENREGTSTSCRFCQESRSIKGPETC